MPKLSNFLILDYDKTLHHEDFDGPHHISPLILDFAGKKNYVGFYGCTHRSYSHMRFFIQHRKGTHESYYIDDDNEGATFQITQNFEQISKLPCQAVSILDDILYQECGKAYEQLLLPLEKYGKTNIDQEKYIAHKKRGDYLDSKNAQLLHIAKHVASTHQNDQIHLDYIDDVLKLCETACNAHLQENWPKNVSLHVYHKQSLEIKLISPVEEETQSLYQTNLPLFNDWRVAAEKVNSPVKIINHYQC
ncbi:MAG: hypothetical protein ACD_46C00531G0002 [uncultured bacterium]|nr:MAG: hypothetical protein ACD_46C00531G0002 [uncultured bacterium]